MNAPLWRSPLRALLRGHQDYSDKPEFVEAWGTRRRHLNNAEALVQKLSGAPWQHDWPEEEAAAAEERTKSQNVRVGWERWRQGYHAAELKLDAALRLIFEQLDTPPPGLDAPPLRSSTIVVFHGDHGLSGGEYGVKGKGD